VRLGVSEMTRLGFNTAVLKIRAEIMRKNDMQFFMETMKLSYSLPRMLLSDNLFDEDKYRPRSGETLCSFGPRAYLLHLHMTIRAAMRLG
jgi:hypothetical protein